MSDTHKNRWRNLSVLSAVSSVARSAVLSAAVLMSQTGLAQNGDVNSANETPIDVAIVGTMVGTSFTVGAQFRTGVHAALLHLTDGSLLGRPIRITEYNDSCDRDIAQKLAQDLVQNPPAIVIGHSCSAATLITAPIYTEHKVLQISPASTSPAITELGITTLFRLIGRDDLQGKLVAEYILEKHAGKSLGIFRFSTDYSFNLTETVVGELAAHGVKPTLIIDSAASANSYLNEIVQFMDAGIEVLYMVGSGLDGGVVVRQADQIGASFAIIGSDTLISNTFTDTAGPAGDGIPFLFPSHAAILNETEATRDAIAAVRAQGVEPHGFIMLSYAAAEVWLEGVRRADSIDADSVAAALRQSPILTVLGKVTFDQKGDIQTEYPAYSWVTWQDGVRVSIE